MGADQASNRGVTGSAARPAAPRHPRSSQTRGPRDEVADSCNVLPDRYRKPSPDSFCDRRFRGRSRFSKESEAVKVWLYFPIHKLLSFDHQSGFDAQVRE